MNRNRENGGGTAELIRRLAAFCGPRDIEAPEREKLQAAYGFDRADVMVLFGGSVICGGDVLAQAMKSGAARSYIIVGGEGHTTQALREMVHRLYPEIETQGLPEAEVFNRYLGFRYGLGADALETKSTNCGNNITNLLALLEERHIPCRSIILTQDASMQLRMSAGLRKYRPDWTIINYAAYRAGIGEQDGEPVFTEQIPGMWSMEKYVQLLLGEIARLKDAPGGYGPHGADWIAHVDIPDAVLDAYNILRETYEVRRANPAYASVPPSPLM